MERTFKIKTKSNPDPRGLYPSERRYSASIVIGLSVVFLQLSLFSVLMGTLIINKMTGGICNHDNVTDFNDSENITLDSIRRLEEKLAKDIGDDETLHYYINVPALVCAGCFVMALGSFLSFISGILAWKRWYIDHNITFFFLSSSFSTLTSAICLLLSLLTTWTMNFDDFDYFQENFDRMLPITFSLAVNIIILSLVCVVWSFLATKVAYKGMRNTYPDDIVISKGRGRVQVNTVRKGSKNGNTVPPEIINNFPVGKLAKYLPKKENNNLPKAESNAEYQQRVNKFLSGESENAAENK